MGTAAWDDSVVQWFRFASWPIRAGRDITFRRDGIDLPCDGPTRRIYSDGGEQLHIDLFSIEAAFVQLELPGGAGLASYCNSLVFIAQSRDSRNLFALEFAQASRSYVEQANGSSRVRYPTFEDYQRAVLESRASRRSGADSASVIVDFVTGWAEVLLLDVAGHHGDGGGHLGDMLDQDPLWSGVTSRHADWFGGKRRPAAVQRNDGPYLRA